jgi:hypothetical protein
MTKEEALDLALDWLVCYKDKSMSRNNAEELAEELITAIKQARSAPEEPAFYRHEDGHLMTPDRAKFLGFDLDDLQALYTTQPAAPVQEPAIKQGWDVDTLLDKPAAPVQEPDHGDELTIAYMSGLHDGKKKREWVSLTDDDLEDIAVVAEKGNLQDLRIVIEAKLRSKDT